MKKFISALLVSLVSLTAVEASFAADKAEAPLELKVYNADGNSFHVNSVLVTGKEDAMLIDAQFTRSDAHRLVADILTSGKQLKTIYISHGDPDFYFGLEVIKAEFPEAKIYASQPTIDWINKTVAKKVTFWGPKMGLNAPKAPVIPVLLPAEGLKIEGHSVEVKGLDGALPGRSYVWIPAIKAVVGGVNVFSGLHLWTADTQTKESRQSWFEILEGIEALQPATVIPGHSAANAATGLEAVKYSKTYLTAFEQQLAKADNSATLIKQLKTLYPEAGLGIALNIGAKVNTGEMKW